MPILTKWNIGDVMFGPRQMAASADDLISAGVKAYDDAQVRIARKCREMVKKGQNG